MVISFKVSEGTKEKLNEFYQDLKREKTPDYACFQAKDGDTVVTLYESGKVVFQGSDADLASDFWIATERLENKNLVVNNSDNKKKDSKESKKTFKYYYKSTIGSDEVGTGDYFGPIVVTAAFVDKSNIEFLESLGVRDSKKMTDEKILEIVPQIIKRIPYSSIALSNSDYNSYHEKGMNMNKIKAILHNKVLFDLRSKTNNYDYIIMDQFAEKYVYFSYLKEVSNKVNDIVFLTKAEDQVLSVAAASLISRFLFIKEFSKLEKELDMLLPKGASNEVDLAGKKIVEKYGKDKLKSIAKISFKNTEKILND